MNYQNNIDAYYAYAKENHKRRKRKEKRVKWLWLIIPIIILLGIFAYFTNLNLQNLFALKDESNKNSSSEISLATDSTRKDEITKSIKIGKNDNFSSDKARDIKIKKRSENSDERGKTPYDLLSKENMKGHPGTLGNVTKDIVNDNITMKSPKEMDKNNSVENPLVAHRKSFEMNSSLKKDTNASLSLLKGTDVNGSLKEEQIVEKNVSVELYHVYIVSRGENIYDIARKEYGDTQMYIEIVNANQDLENPNKIREGQELFLPIVNESKSYSEILHFK